MTGFRKLSTLDDLGIISEWIYESNENFFLELFGSRKESIRSILLLLKNPYLNYFHRNFVTVVYGDKLSDVKGIVIAFDDSTVSWIDCFNALYEIGLKSHLSIYYSSALSSFFSSYGDYCIASFYVGEDYRRSGVGSKLLEKVKLGARQRNLENIVVNVYHDDVNLQNFYSKHGFKKDNLNLKSIFNKVHGYSELKCKL